MTALFQVGKLALTREKGERICDTASIGLRGQLERLTKSTFGEDAVTQGIGGPQVGEEYGQSRERPPGLRSSYARRR
jgi:hypothetical protein